MHKWEVKNLPPYPGCCQLDIANDNRGITVEKGKTYWIVAKTDSTNADAQDTGNTPMTIAFPTTVAVKSGSTRWVRLRGFLAGFGVFGTKP